MPTKQLQTQQRLLRPRRCPFQRLLPHIGKPKVVRRRLAFAVAPHSSAARCRLVAKNIVSGRSSSRSVTKPSRRTRSSGSALGCRRTPNVQREISRHCSHSMLHVVCDFQNVVTSVSLIHPIFNKCHKSRGLFSCDFFGVAHMPVI